MQPRISTQPGLVTKQFLFTFAFLLFLSGCGEASTSASSSDRAVTSGGSTTDSVNVTIGSPSTPTYDLSAFDIAHTVTWPTPPTTTSVINVPADMEFSQAVQVDGAQVIVAAGYSGAGITFGFGNDVEIIMDNTASITSLVRFGAAQRVSWTGGNITQGMNTGSVEDLLLNNINVSSTTASSAIVIGGLAGGGSEFKRVAIINCTGHSVGISGSGWGLALWGAEAGTDAEDVIVANGLFGTDNYQGNRINGITRLTIVDTLTHAQTDMQNASWRFHHSNTNVHVENTVGIGHMLNIPVSGDPAGGTYNLEMINHHQFNLTSSTSQFMIENAPFPANTGTITGSTTHYEGGAGSFGPYNLTDGGGNSRVSWDGSTFDFSELPGKTAITDYGADH